MPEVSRALVQLLMYGIWLLTVFAFVRRKATPSKSETTTRRDSMSRLGIAVQAIAFMLSWVGPPWVFIRSRPAPRMPGWIAAVGLALGLAGALLVIRSVRTLGREWSFTARVLEGHRLVTGGPYATVRNPIYTGMWGLQLATAIAFSTWIWWGLLPIAAVIYYAGTVMRVRSEEKLLRAEFGAEFEEYARRVPAIIPQPFGSPPKNSSASAP